MSALKIAVVGAGLIGQRHIQLINQSDECELAAIVDPAPTAAEIARESSVAHYEDLGQLLGKPASSDNSTLDGVVLATPNALHYTQALECIDANIPVLIEKPISQTTDQARHLVDKVASQQARVIVGHHRMHSAIMQQAKRIIDSGAIGNIVAVQGAALFYKPDAYYEAGPWRTKSGGGPILINMIHEIGNLRYLCDEITQVQAMPSNAQRGFEVEDTVAISLGFESGAVGTFILSDTAASCKSWEQTAKENLDYHHDSDENCYHIAGTRGSLSIPTMTMHRFQNNEEPSWYKAPQVVTEPVEVSDPLVRQLSHFCRVIRGEEEPLVSAEDGYRNLQLTEAIALACEQAGSADNRL